MPVKREILGIYLGNSGIQCQRLRGGLGGWRLLPFSASLPERGKSSPEALKAVLSQLRPSKARAISLGLPRKWIFLREMTFPGLEPEEAENAVRLAIGLHAHLDPEDIFFDQYAFERDGVTTVLLAYIPRHVLEPYFRVIQETGHWGSLAAVSPATLGLDVLLREGLGPEPPCLFVGRQGDDLVVSLHGEEGWEGSHVVLPHGTGDLAAGLGEVMECLPGSFSGKDLPLYWMGDPARCPGAIGDRVRGCGKVTALGRSDLEYSWGLCAAALSFVPYPALSLQPGLRKRPWRMRVRAYQLAAGVLAAVLVLATGLAGFKCYGTARDVSSLESRARDLERRIDPLRKTKEQLDEIDAELADIRSFTASKTTALDVLRYLATLTPRDTWIKTFSLQRDRLRISAEGRSAVRALAAWREAPLFTDVKLISPVTKRGMGTERFSVEIVLVETRGMQVVK